jgi:hypothetical protein
MPRSDHSAELFLHGVVEDRDDGHKTATVPRRRLGGAPCVSRRRCCSVRQRLRWLVSSLFFCTRHAATRPCERGNAGPVESQSPCALVALGPAGDLRGQPHSNIEQRLARRTHRNHGRRRRLLRVCGRPCSPTPTYEVETPRRGGCLTPCPTPTSRPATSPEWPAR